ncbi:folate-binding protein YgfZ [Methylococcaceae bacterium CS1]|nr:folate-binding protein YgfZ [Methyloprofundus sp.]TXK94503.1 folate-binding protein YgfZ [Methylococcaceae bacterium CS4]TXK95206.1 folate-binding protein YgfZ [Methylococcaceae bacterium CS5]TXL06181.1 folate-binding protein YgfZ [Methylococcaceae bacterium CS1]TXL06532.1 folate-binding protein YgfZ [Methylococcaceae bacterium CS3]TXL06870.1 folate-binding protein YgfZ [Methylococcaceae bacterium CS2]
MHADWISYLNTLELSPQTPADKQAILAPLNHLSVLSVTGKDAANFLQGQTTCDINALVDSKPALGAYCNAKGRTISTFIIIKQQNEFQLILTKDLIDTVRKKLQMYVLRSDVQLTDQSELLCITGIFYTELPLQTHLYQYPQLDNSYLFIGNAEESCLFWSELRQQQTIRLISSSAWLWLDIQAGIPWLYPPTSEEFVPQMLNLDKLNAISFEKGCYTGQEVVARTHYLGKNKRAMYQASCTTETDIPPGSVIIDNEDAVQGTVVLTTIQDKTTQLLVVLKDQAVNTKNLQLKNQNHDKITLN